MCKCQAGDDNGYSIAADCGCNSISPYINITTSEYIRLIKIAKANKRNARIELVIMRLKQADSPSIREEISKRIQLLKIEP